MLWQNFLSMASKQLLFIKAASYRAAEIREGFMMGALAGQNIPRPVKFCYWVDCGNLLAGEYPRSLDEQASIEKMRALRQAGIEIFIDLTSKEDGLITYEHFLDGAQRFNYPILDVSVPEKPEQMINILDAIDLYLGKGRKVYVHCWGGIGRTGVVVGCWLARHNGGGKNGLALLQELWKDNPKSALRDSPETPEQIKYVLHWPAGK